MPKSGTALVWFRRDLRLNDNPALSAALEQCAQVIPLYIHAPEEEAPWSPGEASNWWLHHSLCALRQDLQRAGSELITAAGPTLDRLREIATQTGATHLFWNRRYEPAVIARDKRIKQALSDTLLCQSFNASLLNEPGTILTAKESPYKVFSAYWKACLNRSTELPAPRPRATRIPTPPLAYPSPEISALKLLPKINWYSGLERVWQPGEQGALNRWAHFLDGNLDGYDDRRDFPNSEGTSRLSPHLHFGEISPRQLLWGLRHLADRHPAISRHLERFSCQIGWREFAYDTLFHAPKSSNRSLDERFEQSSLWSDDAESAEKLRRWRHGETGIPIVDAGMQQLWQTGWMHNRVRMIVASLLTKNLGIHWLQGARWFWDTLVDADLANNSLGWQWTAGCGVDAAPYFRVFNPARQAGHFDAAGHYIKQWLPQLTEVEINTLHNGRRPSDRELDYPLPIVDLHSSRLQVLERWEAIKRLKR